MGKEDEPGFTDDETGGDQYAASTINEEPHSSSQYGNHSNSIKKEPKGEEEEYYPNYKIKEEPDSSDELE